MPTAFAYARVSTKDQETFGNSIPEQFARIERYASERGITILRRFQDADSAYHDENRAQFNEMISLALTEKPDYLIFDDSSRFARTRKVAILTRELLKEHGIHILFANEPNLDPNSVAALWITGIQEIKNEATSMEIAANVIRGMTGNIKARDPETGWCYKNGGRAPYGYRITHLHRGTDTKGKPVIKTIWHIDPTEAAIVRRIIVDWYVGENLSYNAIRDRLNQQGIPGPEGKPWGTSTIVEMLRENRLHQYAGTAFWNKERSRKQKTGGRFRPRDKWVEVPNAHPAIITPEELQAALERKAAGRALAPLAPAQRTTYLFTGPNLQNQPLFICATCQSAMVGSKQSSSHRRRYRCGRHQNKGPAGCPNASSADADQLEAQVIQEINKRFTSPHQIEEMVARTTDNLRRLADDHHRAIQALREKVSQADLAISRLLDAIKAGIDPQLIAEEISRVKQQREKQLQEIERLENNPPYAASIKPPQIRDFFQNAAQIMFQGTPAERKRLIRTYIHQMVFDPEKQEVRVAFYPDYIVQAIGVGGGT